MVSDWLSEGSGEWKVLWTRSRTLAANPPHRCPTSPPGTEKPSKSAARWWWPPNSAPWYLNRQETDTPRLIDATQSVILLSTMAVRMDNSSTSSTPRNKINYNKMTVGHQSHATVLFFLSFERAIVGIGAHLHISLSHCWKLCHGTHILHVLNYFKYLATTASPSHLPRSQCCSYLLSRLLPSAWPWRSIFATSLRLCHKLFLLPLSICFSQLRGCQALM